MSFEHFFGHEVNRSLRQFERDPFTFLQNHPQGDVVHRILFGQPLDFRKAERENYNTARRLRSINAYSSTQTYHRQRHFKRKYERRSYGVSNRYRYS